MHDFRRLHVWQMARDLAAKVERLAGTFPRHDQGLVANQLRRSTISISANIAEGCGKDSPKELIRFLQIAAGSVAETENHLLIATDLGYIHPKTGDALVAQTVKIRRMLYRLKQSIAAREKAPATGT
jgi:four helix bundle protein